MHHFGKDFGLVVAKIVGCTPFKPVEFFVVEIFYGLRGCKHHTFLFAEIVLTRAGGTRVMHDKGRLGLAFFMGEQRANGCEKA